MAITLNDLLGMADRLRERGVIPLDFSGAPTSEPVVLAWMPAASLYFKDPDGHSLEYICMLEETARPDLGVVAWSEWQKK